MFSKSLNARAGLDSDPNESALKVDRKYSNVLMALFMTLAMDTTMTLTMTLIMTGFGEGFAMRFLGGFVIGFVVGFPTSLLVIPNVRKLVSRLTED